MRIDQIAHLMNVSQLEQLIKRAQDKQQSVRTANHALIHSENKNPVKIK